MALDARSMPLRLPMPHVVLRVHWKGRFSVSWPAVICRITGLAFGWLSRHGGLILINGPRHHANIPKRDRAQTAQFRVWDTSVRSTFITRARPPHMWVGDGKRNGPIRCRPSPDENIELGILRLNAALSIGPSNNVAPCMFVGASLRDLQGGHVVEDR